MSDSKIENPMIDFHATANKAILELQGAINDIKQVEIDRLCMLIKNAKRIALYGVGREGLMMKAFAMRLFHLGLDVHVIGDMTTAPIGKGDLLLISAGPGYFSTVEALRDVAKKAGAVTSCFTAEPEGKTPKACDYKVVLPAQTMANDKNPSSSVLPMGSLYEGAQYIAFEIIILTLRDMLLLSADTMRNHHTNLE